jgi:hypothetical protein
VAAHITATQVQTWLESTKLAISSLDPALESQVSTQVLGRLTETYAAYVPLWVDATTTPAIVQQVIAMMYAGWLYDRAYSEVVSQESGASYGMTLRNWATTLLNDIISGAISIAEIEPNQPATAPVFYPTDASSTHQAVIANADWNDQSLGPAKFTVDKIF